MQTYEPLKFQKSYTVTIGTDEEINMAEVIDAAISFYLEEGYFRRDDNTKYEFTLEVVEDELSGTCCECDQPATTVAEHSGTKELGKYCDKHARKAVDFHNPEYHVSCPNCGCDFGVN